MQESSSQPIGSSPKHSNIVLGIVMLGTLMGALDSTIVLLAFPTINDSLHSDLATSLVDNSGLPSCPRRCNYADGQNRRHLWQKQNIQLRLRNFHRRLSAMRFLTSHLPANRLQSCSSGRRSYPASHQRSHNSRLFPQRKTRQSIRLQFAWVSQLEQCLA